MLVRDLFSLQHYLILASCSRRIHSILCHLSHLLLRLTSQFHLVLQTVEDFAFIICRIPCFMQNFLDFIRNFLLYSRCRVFHHQQHLIFNFQHCQIKIFQFELQLFIFFNYPFSFAISSFNLSFSKENSSS